MTSQYRDLTVPVVESHNYRTFVSVKEPNTRIQIIESLSPENEPLVTSSGLIHKTTRIGDKFVEFQDGFCITEDPDVIRWCESHFPDVLDYDDPKTGALVPIARLSTPRDNYEPEVEGNALFNAVDASIENTVQQRLRQRMIELGMDPDSDSSASDSSAAVVKDAE